MEKDSQRYSYGVKMRPSSITPMGTKFQRRRGGVHMGRDETDSAMGNASSARKLEQAGTDSPGGAWPG